MAADTARSRTLTSLPSELIDQVLAYLPLCDLIRVSSTCRTLHQHSHHDPLWQAFIHDNLPAPISTPGPANSYRELFLRHHPHWFLTRHQIWFSDAPLHGKLIFVRYDPRRGCIEGYTVVAERGPHEHGILSWHSQVLYDTFRPRVKLDLNQPVLRLDLHDAEAPVSSFNRETPMRIHSGNTRRITSIFLPTRGLSDVAKSNSSISMWPPPNIPSPGDQRTRNVSPSAFTASGHTPDLPSELSQASFRIRQWIEYGHFIPIAPLMHQPNSRVGESVYTFGTLAKDAYTPTPEKPWQGIWCGDYGGHGCEFLLVTQRDDPGPLPEKAQRAFDMGPDVAANHNSFGLIGMINSDEDDQVDDFDDDESDLYGATATTGQRRPSARRRPTRSYTGPSPHDKAPYKGRLEAIKLTGDPNVPRGEYTFIAPDIGANGLVGHATEPVFNEQPQPSPASSSFSTATPDVDLHGARIVRGVGHIAGTGFTNDTYIPTQLIMISPNRLAQYWLPFRHVSFFERVNFERFFNADGGGTGARAVQQHCAERSKHGW